MEQKTTTARLASSYVNNTNRHIFLTGKAGTGKTTFLHEIVRYTHKSCIVAAPTGVAAINAGGVTLHSLFQLPFGTFVPVSSGNLFSAGPESPVNTPDSMLKQQRIGADKRRMLREMELLIIDEVSMLRADILDAIDIVLRSIRRKPGLSFGGVQLLMIGDMLQLPPVVKSRDWDYLSPHYKSAYFFDSLALQRSKPVYIELEKIYRQTERAFIRLLGNLRENKLEEEDIHLLNKSYVQHLNEEQKSGAVFLTTHNHQAAQINNKHLEELPGKAFRFHAQIKGDFPEYYYPLDETLLLKKNAQVMFVKNDHSGEQRYYNGKIGKVEKLSRESIVVSFDDGSEAVEVELYHWENKRFGLNPENGEIEEKILGQFTHFPLKLAWAITIHKSQGLTFSKAIIDVSKAFAPGQIYVALSRLRSLKGLLLTAPVPSHGISPDNSLLNFSRQKQQEEELKENLKYEAINYTRDFLQQAYDFSGLNYQLQEHIRSYDKNEKQSEKQKHKSWALALKKKLEKPSVTAEKFRKQLHILCPGPDNADIPKLKERVTAAKEYFEPVFKELSGDIQEHQASLAGLPGTKKYRKELDKLESGFFLQLKKLYKSEQMVESLLKDRELTKDTMEKIRIGLEKSRAEQETQKGKPRKKKEDLAGKPSKGASAEHSFSLYQSGMNIEQIATERGLAFSTIEGHLAQQVAKGKLSATDFVDKTRMKQIIKAHKAVKSTQMSDIKAVLGDEFSWSDIRFAMAGYYSEKE
ncbi:MAG: helix-turn-helix domain-containing protein [Bacteroidales bacterium]